MFRCRLFSGRAPAGPDSGPDDPPWSLHPVGTSSPPALQVHLLRVLDGDGEYQRLGEGRTRRASFRLIAATNRPIEALKHDFAARFKIRVELPGLDRRREDIPLLLRHLLQAEARKNPNTARRFFEHRGGMIAEARIDPRVIEALLRHRFTLHMRELEQFMLVSIATSPGDYLTLTPELREELAIDQAAKAAAQARRARAEASFVKDRRACRSRARPFVAR